MPHPNGPPAPTPATSPPPVWLLDIDGVLNATSRHQPPPAAWPADVWIDTKAQGLSRTWRILAARPVADFIRTIHQQHRAEIRWHTTWQHDATQVAAALGLPDFPVQDAPEFHRAAHLLARDEWWKLPAVWRILAFEGRRVIWTDDDADPDLTDEQKTTLAAAGCHIVSPDPTTGLTAEHLRDIDEMLTSWATP